MSDKKAEDAVVALERTVLDRWGKGDPWVYAENAADDVTYFDHLTDSLRVGLEELKAHIPAYEGKVNVPRYEIDRQHISVEGDLAVSVFNWYTYSADGQVTSRWNATEVFRRVDGQWKYVHMHWARVKEGQ
jgi:ketosteroid isomerase-like protein